MPTVYCSPRANVYKCHSMLMQRFSWEAFQVLECRGLAEGQLLHQQLPGRALKKKMLETKVFVLKSRNLWSELKGRNCYMETDSISLLVIYLHCVLQYIQGPTLLLLWPLGQTPPSRWQEPPEHHSLPRPVRGSQILESFWTQSGTFTIFFNLHFIQIITLHEISLSKTNCT